MPNLPKRGQLGTCEKLLDKDGDGKIHLTAVTKETNHCEFSCNEGFAKNNAKVQCTPNNKDGSTTDDGVGEFTNAFTCVGKYPKEGTQRHHVMARAQTDFLQRT